MDVCNNIIRIAKKYNKKRILVFNRYINKESNRSSIKKFKELLNH